MYSIAETNINASLYYIEIVFINILMIEFVASKRKSLISELLL